MNLSLATRVSLIITLLLSFTAAALHGQGPVYSYFYRIYLRDKGANATVRYSASDLLSPRAISRRTKAGITFPDFRDIPVDKNYTDQISLLGLKLHTTSKWLNTALFKSQTPFDVNKLLALQFVSEVKIVKTPGTKSFYKNKLDLQITQTNLPLFDRQITMLNGDLLHNSGYNGKGVLVAILDGGFTSADKISSLSALRTRKGIKSTYDFVNKNKSVYNYNSHGTAVLSVLAGDIPGVIEGSAPGADYILLKTEDVDSEFPCEEDFWAAGAEYADSAGADIISSSLGYFNFDDPGMNYKVSDLDGNTAFVTRAADYAASKGILVVNSAGNERLGIWKYIIFPSDGDSVLAAGAVNGDKIIADFSSAGPSADHRIKPDNAAMGVDVTVQVAINQTGTSNGTSFSCPVLSGMAACLLQAVPLAINNDVIKSFHLAGDRYSAPDSLYGYGIPDMVSALNELQNLYLKVTSGGILVYPNPTTGSFEVDFQSPPENLTIEILTISGKLIFRKSIDNFAGRSIIITELQHCAQGIYFLRLITKSQTKVEKIIKIKN